MIDHHAVLYITESADVVPTEVVATCALFETVQYTLSTLSIKDVRNIIDKAHQKPFATEFQYIVINADVIPVEAQNALLKVLEEPPVSTRFIVMVRPHTMLLGTVRSRLLCLSNDLTPASPSPLFSEFLDCDIAARLGLIANYAKAKNDEAFLNLYQGLLFRLTNQAGAKEKVALAPLLSYLQLRGASKKMVWEDIALRLPVGRQ